MNKELSFMQLKQIAKFFAGIIDYKSPFTSTHSIGVAKDSRETCKIYGAWRGNCAENVSGWSIA